MGINILADAEALSHDRACISLGIVSDVRFIREALARDGEKVLALDGREYTLTPDMCVIADQDGVESIAGIMGGEHSGCDENTTDVLIESALWDPITTARTGRTLGIISDALYRFERGVDPEFMVPGVELATRLVLDFCGGTPTEIEVTGYAGSQPRIVSFPLSEVKRLTAIEVPRAESLDILSRLGFKSQGSETTRCSGSSGAAAGVASTRKRPPW